MTAARIKDQFRLAATSPRTTSGVTRLGCQLGVTWLRRRRHFTGTLTLLRGDNKFGGDW